MKHVQKNEVKQSSILTMNILKSSVRDALFKIGRLNANFSMFDTISHPKELADILETSSAQVIDELEECHRETYSTRKLITMEWPREL